MFTLLLALMGEFDLKELIETDKWMGPLFFGQMQPRRVLQLHPLEARSARRQAPYLPGHVRRPPGVPAEAEAGEEGRRWRRRRRWRLLRRRLGSGAGAGSP